MGVQVLPPTDEFPIGWEGSPARDDVKPVNRKNGSAVPIPFGRFVGLDATQQQGSAGIPTVELVDSATVLADIDGVSAWSNHEISTARGTLTSPGSFPAYADETLEETITIYTEGEVYMRTVDAVTPNSPVYAVIDNAQADLRGRVRGTADGANTLLLPDTKARFKSGAGAGELVVVSIQFV